jgi:hypothetical protein
MDLTRFYEHYKLYEKDALDYMTNAEYKTYKAEPNYAILITLYRSLPKDALKIIIKYSYDNLETRNLSGRTIRRLISRIENCLFDEFKFVYDLEYMCDPNIINFFEFDKCDVFSEWNMYPLCDCRSCCHGNNYCYDCMPERLKKNYYVKRCRCKNGKRYIAYSMIYLAYIMIDSILQNSGSTDIEIEKYTKMNKKYTYASKDIVGKMMDYVIQSGPIDINYQPVMDIE